MQRRPWHRIHLDAAEVAALLAGRQRLICKVIRPEKYRGRDLADPLRRLELLASCPYGASGHTLWSQESADQHESGARARLRVERIVIRRLHELTVAEIRAVGIGDSSLSNGQLCSMWREYWDRQHSRKGERWSDDPWLWSVRIVLISDRS